MKFTDVKENPRADAAGEKLAEEAEQIRKKPGNDFKAIAKRNMAGLISDKLADFAVQDDTGTVAGALLAENKSLDGCLDDILRHITKERAAVPDAEIYKAALTYYLPGSHVRATFRVQLPEDEHDDDLLFSAPTERKAIILDLTGEEGE